MKYILLKFPLYMLRKDRYNNPMRRVHLLDIPSLIFKVSNNNALKHCQLYRIK